MRNAIVAVVLVGLASFAAAQPKQWENVGIGGGGGILTPSFSPHDPNLLFASSDMSGVYRSTDQGRNWAMLPWRQLSQADTCYITFHPTDPNTMYVVPGPWATQRLKVSTDKGVTWKNLCEEMPWAEHGQVNLVALSPDGKVILVASEKATFRSDDNGKTWAKCEGIDSKVHGFLLAPGAKKQAEIIPTWFAGTANGVMFSVDGKRWQACKSQPGPSLAAFCGGHDAKTDKFVLYASVPTGAANGKFTGGIFRSEDLGNTWTSCMGEGINTTVNSPTATAKAQGRGAEARATAQYNFLAMAANQTDTVYTFCFGNGDGPRASTVYKTADAGKTWRPVLIPADSQLRVGKTSTPDGEADMKQPAGGQPVKGNVELGWLNLDVCWMSDRILGFTVNPANSDQVAFTNWMEIFVTSDGGQSWRQAYSRCAQPPPARGAPWGSIGMEMTTTWHYRFDPHDPNRTYICYTDIGFARSEDRGHTWRYAVQGSPHTNTFYDLALDPEIPGRSYAAVAYEHDIPAWKMAERVYGGGGVCVSSDYAKTWTPLLAGLPTPGPCTAVVIDPKSPKQNRTLYCTMYGSGVYKSTDGGANWQPASAGLKTEQNAHFSDLKLHADGTLLALCTANRKERESLAPGGLFRSTDGGASWTDLTAELKLRQPYGFDVDPTDSKVIYLGACAVPRHHDEAGLYKTLDGGKSWKKLEIPWPPSEIGYQHIYFPSVDPYNAKRVWICAGTHGFMVTTDAGGTWKEVKGVPFKHVSRVTVDPKDHERIWVTTFGGGVWTGPAMGTD